MEVLFLTVLFAQAGWPDQAKSETLDADSPQDLASMGLEDLMKIKVDTVFAASKRTQKLTEAPANVTVITAEQIRRHGYRTLAEMLRGVSGFYTTYNRYYINVGVRGFSRPGDYNSRILVMIDGHRVNDNIFDAAAVGTDFPLDMGLIARVEVIRGPGSSLYGASAFLAVINVITKKGEQIDGVQIRTSGGSQQTVESSVAYGGHFKSGLDLVAQGSLYKSQGGENLYFPEFDSAENNRGIAENADQDQYDHFFGNLHYKGFNFQGMHSFRKKGLAAAPWEVQFNDPRNIAWDGTSYFNFSYEKTSADKKTDYFAQFYVDRYINRGDYLYNYMGEPDSILTLNKDDVKGNSWGAEARARRTLEKHILTAGVEFRDIFKQELNNFDVVPYGSYVAEQRHSENGGFYLQDEWKPRSWFLLNAGIRYDRYSTFGGTLNPRLNLIFNPSQRSVLKVLYGRAFRPPTVYELYYHDNIQTKSNPNLKPEKISTYELAFEHKLGGHLNVLASGYCNRINQLIDLRADSSDDLLSYQNTGSAKAKGLSIGMEGSWDERLEARVNYDFQRAVDKTTQSWLTNSPQHMVNANLSAPLWQKNLIAGLDVQGYSKRKTKNNTLTAGYLIANLTLTSRRIWNRVEAGFSLYNLLDRQYADPAPNDMRQESIVQDGRVFLARIHLYF
jgi:outer membrane receptor for ferrienterochelin and colicins